MWIKSLHVLISLIFIYLNCPLFADDHIVPDTIKIKANKEISQFYPEIGDTVKVVFSLLNEEQDSLKSFYFVDHIPQGIELITKSVLLNDLEFYDYKLETEPANSVYSKCASYRWIIEEPFSGASGDRYPILPNNGSVRIEYSLIYHESGTFTFPGYNWVGMLEYSEDNSIYIFGFEDSLISSSVPIELASFSAKIIGNDIELNWLTISESNNYGFEVERCNSNEDNFKSIGFVKGCGNSSTIQRYQFIDKEISIGTYYYRLKQIDNNGSFEYTNSIEVNINTPDKFILDQNYPNPFNDATIISYVIPISIIKSGEFVKVKTLLRVYNVNGQVIRTLVDDEKQIGYHKIIWDGKDYKGHPVASGIYFYSININSFLMTKKLILLR